MIGILHRTKRGDLRVSQVFSGNFPLRGFLVKPVRLMVGSRKDAKGCQVRSIRKKNFTLRG